MTHHSLRLMCYGALTASAGCAASETPDNSAVEANAVSRAVAVAQAVTANPGAVDSVLTAHGLTEASFDSLIYQIASDPDLSREYEAALR